MSSPQPYVIDVPQSKIENLQKKLSLAEYPDQLEDAGWDLGCPLAEIKRLAEAWEKWDWRQAEKLLNELPQFHVEIEVKGFETLDIHFVHQKSEVTGAIPLLFVHGCKFRNLFALQQSLSFPFILGRLEQIFERHLQGRVLSLKYGKFFHYLLNVMAAVRLSTL